MFKELDLSPYFLTGFSGFVLTFVFVLIALRLFPKIGLMDRPARYGLTRSPIPYYGGLAMFFTFIICVFFFIPFSRELLGLLAALILIVSMSFLDDLFQIRPLYRLAGQIAAALIVVGSGIGIRSISNPLGETFFLDQWSFQIFGVEVLVLGAFFTIAWIVFVVNSMNFFDGVPGLLSGVSFFAFLLLFLLSLRGGNVIDQTQLMYLSSILAGICLAFAIFDFPVPKILMGDTGSMFLGFLLAVSAIFSGGKVATVAIVLGFPLFDALWSIIRRLGKGQSPFKGDLSHLHHKLLKSGLNERQVVLLIYAVSVFFGYSTLFLDTFQKMIAIGAILFTMIFLGILLFFRQKRIH